jgi:hypothetical protein
MKWFQHDTDMHTDLKIQTLMEKHGLEGYAIYNLCLEILGKEGKKGKLGCQLRWQEGLLKVAGWSDKGKLNSILNTMAELRLICPKSLKYGTLYIPNFLKRADNWTRQQLRSNFKATMQKLQSDYEETSSTIQYNTINKKYIHSVITFYLQTKKWDFVLRGDNVALRNSIWKRNVKPAKQLLELVGDVEKAQEVIAWLGNLYQKKGLDWTLETVIAKLPEYYAKPKEPKYRRL